MKSSLLKFCAASHVNCQQIVRPVLTVLSKKLCQMMPICSYSPYKTSLTPYKTSLNALWKSCFQDLSAHLLIQWIRVEDWNTALQQLHGIVCTLFVNFQTIRRLIMKSSAVCIPSSMRQKISDRCTVTFSNRMTLSFVALPDGQTCRQYIPSNVRLSGVIYSRCLF